MVRITLRRAGLKSGVEQKMLLLSRACKWRSLKCVLEHQDWALEDWSRVD
jgi:hypothetical protein